MHEKGNITYLNIIFLLIMMSSIISFCLVKTTNIIRTSSDTIILRTKMEMETTNFNNMEKIFNNESFNNDALGFNISTTSKKIEDDLYLVSTIFKYQESYEICFYFRLSNKGYELEKQTISVINNDN